MKLIVTESAKRDLRRLRLFIAKHNPAAAKRISQRLKKSIFTIVDQPHMGSDPEEIEGVQDPITGGYIVRYTILGENAYVLKVWHGKETR